MHIRIIVPIVNAHSAEESRHVFSALSSPETEISAVSLAWGTAAIEARADDAWAAPGVLNRAIEAERDGVDALVIDCMDDPGLYAAREAVRIPVIGPAEASLHLAAMLAQRFSIITTNPTDIPTVEELVGRYRLQGKLASVRALSIPVLQLATDEAATFEALVRAGEEAVQQDGAGALVLGCTLLAGQAQRASEELARRGCDVPVLNPRAVALKAAEAHVALGLCHSAHTYARPGEKRIAWPVPAAFSAEERDR